MSLEGWLVFAGFWVIFVTSPGPNAVNAILNGLTHGLPRALFGVLGILTQAVLFLTLSAAGVTAQIAASPTAFFYARLLGAGVLIWLGLRGWLRARTPVAAEAAAPGRIYFGAFLIATVNAKSLAGYLAAFSQFVEPGVPIWEQMRLIFPTALAITAASYTGYTLLGAWLGRLALGAVMHVRVRQVLAVCFVAYGVALLLAGGLRPV